MIPESYKIDFGELRRDLVSHGLGRMLEQFRSSCVLRQFLAALLEEVQELHDAALDVMEQRTLFRGAGENLNALGRIVGEERAPYSYDESRWFFADRLPQGTDKAACWQDGVPFAAFIPIRDNEYRTNILARIHKNHALTASVPELTRIGPELTGYDISFQKTGPNEVRVLVPTGISLTALSLYTNPRTDALADHQYAMPYPATLSISEIVILPPVKFFCADRMNPQGADSGPCAVGAVQSPL